MKSHGAYTGVALELFMRNNHSLLLESLQARNLIDYYVETKWLHYRLHILEIPK